jgi:hypothetical protein
MVTRLFSEGACARRCPDSGRLRVPPISSTPPNRAWRHKQPNLWPPVPRTLHQTVSRTAPEPPRSLAVVPPLAERRYYGEAPGRLRRGYGDEQAVGDATPPFHPNRKTIIWPVTPKTAVSGTISVWRVLELDRGATGHTPSPRAKRRRRKGLTGSRKCHKGNRLRNQHFLPQRLAGPSARLRSC